MQKQFLVLVLMFVAMSSSVWAEQNFKDGILAFECADKSNPLVLIKNDDTWFVSNTSKRVEQISKTVFAFDTDKKYVHTYLKKADDGSKNWILSTNDTGQYEAEDCRNLSAFIDTLTVAIAPKIAENALQNLVEKDAELLTLKQEHEVKMLSLRENSKSNLLAVGKRHRNRIGELRRELAALRESSISEITTLKQEHEAKLLVVDDTLTSLRENLKTALDDATIQRYGLKETIMKKDRELEKLKRELTRSSSKLKRFFFTGKGIQTFIFENGSKYVGEWMDGNRHGQGTFTDTNGEEYVGEWLNGNRHGQGTFFDTKGGKYVGEWLDGNRHGQGTFTDKKGTKYVGAFKQNKRDGVGSLLYVNGDTYVGAFTAGKQTIGRLELAASGNVYEGTFKYGKFDGQGTYTFGNGDTYVGTFKNDMFNGEGTLDLVSSGAKHTGQYKDDLFNGQGTYTYPDGTREIGIWRDGILQE